MSLFDVRLLIQENQRTHHFPRLADLFVVQPENLPELVALATRDDVHPYPQYASWLILHVARKDHNLLSPFYNQIIDCILTTSHPSVLRSLLGASICMPLRDYNQGEFLDRLFALLNDPDTKPGQVNYSLQKVAEFLELYPELQQEMDLIVSFREEMNINPGLSSWFKTFQKKRKKACIQRGSLLETRY